MRSAALSFAFLAIGGLAAAPDGLRMPVFPVPTLALDGGAPIELTALRLLRELHRSGLSGFDRLETVDADYALLSATSVEPLTVWLDATCSALDYDLRAARRQAYDGTVFARLLEVAASLGLLQGRNRALAVPIGTVLCQRGAAWGALPADGASDVYVLFATDKGMIVYDPPTRQSIPLADFPNKKKIQRIRF